jgi:GTPase SAR1 family protein
MKSVEQNALVDKISSALNRSKPLAILVLGSVGAGKTTFLEYTRKVTAAYFFEKKSGAIYPHWIHIDFRGFVSGDSPKNFIYAGIFDYIKADDFFLEYKRAIEPAYKADIEALKRGPMYLVAQDLEKFNQRITELITHDYQQVGPYVEKLISYAAKKVPVFLVVDNIDQIETAELESKLFADVLAIGQLLKINIVISMRDSTYARYRSVPVFDAYDFDPIQIDTPKISSVLSKRFQLAKFLAAGVKGEFTAENGAHVKVEDASTFIDLVQSSVLGTEVGRTIEILATDDVRLALRMTRQFLETGYTNPGRALEFFRNDRNYVLPKHEAFRAILHAGAPVYKEELSAVANPFDARTGKTESQLLRLFVLNGLVNLAKMPNFRFVEVQSIIEQLRKIGFGDVVVKKVIGDLCHWRFAFSASHSEVTEFSSLIPSRLGGYVVKELLFSFVFIEAVLMDTFIPNEAIWNELRDATMDIEKERQTIRKIDLRSKRARSFFTLMSGLFDELSGEAIRRGLSKEWCENPLKLDQLDIELSRVSASANRNYSLEPV